MSESTPANDNQASSNDATRRGRDLSGHTLGSFRLLRRLGRGAMAEVYLAEQERLQRQVAVKILKPELAQDRTYLQRFELEARAAASLVHANIVQIYEVGSVEGLHFIAQEYVQGQDLRDYIARHGPPDLPHALSIMRQVAAALAKAAEQGVVHRDIKPENIMLTASGEVKVADFGLARLTTETSNELTQVGVTLGTPLYMSPEQVEGKPLDARSDIYSFGVTCYHMLAGVPPFEGETALGVAVQHLKTRPQPLEARRPDLPPALCRIVHQMLAKSPAERFATGRELLRELRRLQLEHFGDDWPEDLPAWEPLAAEVTSDGQAGTSRKLDQLMKQATVAAKRQRRRRAALVATVLLAFAAGGAVAWCWAVPNSLMAEVKRAMPPVPKESTALRQYYRASQLNSEAGWQSVLAYFPEKKYLGLRAKQQLAMVYLRKDDWQHAMTLFEELAQLNLDDKNLEVELQAFGLAGQCGVLSLRGKYAESNALLAQLAPIRNKLTSEPMRRLVASAVTRNCAKLGQQFTQEWGQWLKEQFHDDS